MFKYPANLETPNFQGYSKQNTSTYSPYYKNSSSNYPRYSSNNRAHNITKKQYPTSSIIERQSVIEEQVYTRQRSVTPQNRRFKYSQNILDICKQSSDKKPRNKQYKYDVNISKRLNNMPEMAKQIYTRIKPKKHYYDQQQAIKNQLLTLGKEDNYSTNKSFTTFSKPLKHNRDVQQIYKQKYDSQIEKLTRNTNKYQLQQKPSIDENEIKKTSKYNIQNLRNIQNCSMLSHKSRSSLSPYKKMNNIVKNHERPKRLELQSKNYQYQRSNQHNISPISYLSNERSDQIDQQGINFKPYQHIIKQPSYLQKTIGSNYSLKQAKATDDSNFKQFNQSQTLDLKNKETKGLNSKKSKQNIDLMFQNQNKPITYQKTRVSFSRQLNEYEDEALKKIQTINELNNKIGQRIKNILNNIS